MEGLCSGHPDVNGDEVLPPSQGTVREGFQSHQDEQLPPCPVYEDMRSPSTYSDTTFAPAETGSVRHDEVVPPTHGRSQHGVGVRTVTVMDILEGGDWPLPYGIEMGDMLVVLP
ncbi:hypothetical protein GY45DRAFT_1324279 [Cubamyces sp. BRFM 1775]|nr:hypothetical protein GY45DRAFT_1324279 [Cubamyces sp. BRFM 1775]